MTFVFFFLGGEVGSVDSDVFCSTEVTVSSDEFGGWFLGVGGVPFWRSLTRWTPTSCIWEL